MAVYQAPRSRRRSTSSYGDTPEATATLTTARGKRKASDMEQEETDVDDEEIDGDTYIDNDTTRKIPDNITPGDRETLDKFHKFRDNQFFCAAYVGFGNVADLRLFILSHYFLQFYLPYRKRNSSPGPTKIVLRTIRDYFLKPGSDKRRFPLDLKDARPQRKKLVVRDGEAGRVDKAKRQPLVDATEAAAHVLILMVEHLDAQTDRVIDPMLQQQRWTELLTIAPHIKKAPVVGDETVKFPTLKTKYVESDLEPYNRAYGLLRYANTCLEQSSWRARAKLIPHASNVVLPNDIPVWMREDAPTMDMEDHQDVHQHHQKDVEEQVEEEMHRTNSIGRRETSPWRELEDGDNPMGLVTSPEPQTRETVIKREPVNTIDLTESPEPEEGQVKQEPVDDVYQSATSSNMREQDGEAVTAEESYRRPALSKRRRMQREEMDEDEDEQDLQSQLKETKLQLKIVQLERRLAAQKKAKKG